MPLPSSPTYRLAEVVMSLSLATDLATGHPLERALRTCLIAQRFADLLHLSEEDHRLTFYAALLRFVGCTADMESLATVFGDEQLAQARVHEIELLPPQIIVEVLRHAGYGYQLLERLRRITYGILYGITSAREAAVAHCEISQNIAQRLGLPATINATLAQLYERWDGQGIPGKAKGDAITLPMRCLHLAQDVELYYRLGGVEGAVHIAQKRAGGAYDPHFVALFVRDAATILADFDRPDLWQTVLGLEPQPVALLTDDTVAVAAQAVADFTDMRSPWARGHSHSVAELGYAAALQYGLNEREARTVQRAGWLHDVGRTAISLTIWDKEGALSASEWEKVRLYPYYTERILSHADFLVPVTTVASQHRERLDGSGYYRGLRGDALNAATRLLAAADVYQSKIEPRAYRAALSPSEAAEELMRQCRASQLDSRAVDAVLAVAHGTKPSTRRTLPAGLSDREVEVLRLVAKGFSNRQIADHLIISPKTAGHHIQHIYNKIGVSTRAAATLFAMQHHLLG